MTSSMLWGVIPSSGVTGRFPILAAAITLVVGFVLYKVVGLYRYVRYLARTFEGTPGPKERHWFYGHMHLFPREPPKRVKFMMSLGRKYRRYFCLWMGPARVTLVVNHPSTIKAIMKTSEPKPLGFAAMYRFGLPWLGTGLLLAGGQRWARSRRLLTPAFHFDILKPYVIVYNDAAEKLLNNLERYAESGGAFEVFEHVSRCTLDIILRCAFSYETDCQKPGPSHPYLVAVNQLTNLWWAREKRIFWYPDIIYALTADGRQFQKHCDYVHQVAEEVIRTRQQTLDSSERSDTPSGKKYLDFLDILLTAKDEQGKGMSLLDIRNEVDTFLFEGHDTTASGISWTLYCLATHPEYQMKVQAELDEVLGSRDDDRIQWADLSRLEYLTMCIKEGLRSYSPVPFIQREFTRDFELDGRTFPAGTSLSVHIYGLHQNPDVWENPDEYRPERFSKDNVAKMDSFQFVPFSAGPRNCIGQHFALNEEKVVIARLLRRYTFSVDPNHVVERKVAAVMRAANGIKMFVTRRKNSY